MPDADWVIDKDNNLHVTQPKNRGYRIGTFLSDLHGKHFYGTNNPVKLAELVNNAHYDAVFMRYLTIDGANYDPEIILQEVKCDKHWVPWSIDPSKFNPRRPCKYDATFIGMLGPPYPLRQKMWDSLQQVAKGYRVQRRRAPTGKGYQRSCELLKHDYIVGKDYATMLGYTRILLFGCSIYRYPLQKFFEGAGSGCLVMSNAFRGADKLGFIDRKTFVDVNIGNWETKLQYYLGNIDECAEIAERGYKNALEKHTHNIRAKQFVEILKK